MCVRGLTDNGGGWTESERGSALNVCLVSYANEGVCNISNLTFVLFDYSPTLAFFLVSVTCCIELCGRPWTPFPRAAVTRSFWSACRISSSCALPSAAPPPPPSITKISTGTQHRSSATDQRRRSSSPRSIERDARPAVARLLGRQGE